MRIPNPVDGADWSKGYWLPMGSSRKRALLGLFLVPAVLAVACGDNGSDEDGHPASAGASGATSSGGSSSGGSSSAGSSSAGASSGGRGNSAGEGATSSAGASAAGGVVESAGGGAGDSASGGTEAAGAGGEGGGAAGSAAAAGGAGAGGAGEEPSSGGQGVGGSPSGEAGAPGCDDDTTRSISGTLDAEPLDYLAYSGGLFSRAAPEFFETRTRVGTNGVLYAFGADKLFNVGDSGVGKGHLFTASEGPFPGTHFCAASAQVTRTSTFRHTISLSDWTTLGSCPAAGSGSLSGCYNSTSGGDVTCGDGQARLIGDIDGEGIDDSFVTNAVVNSGSNPTRTLLTFGNGGLLSLSTISGTGSGFMILPEDASSPGLVVCVGAATLTQGALSNRFSFELDELGVVGTCPGASATSGQIDGCI